MFYAIIFELTDSNDREILVQTKEELNKLYPNLKELSPLQSSVIIKTNNPANVIKEQLLNIKSIIAFYVLPINHDLQNSAIFSWKHSEYEKTIPATLLQLLEDSNQD